MSSTPYRIEPLHIGYIGALVEDPLGDITSRRWWCCCCFVAFPYDLQQSNTRDCHEPNGSRNDATEECHSERSEESGNWGDSISALCSRQILRLRCAPLRMTKREHGHIAAPLKDPLGDITTWGRWRLSTVHPSIFPMVMDEWTDVYSLFIRFITDCGLLYPNSSAIWR